METNEEQSHCKIERFERNLLVKLSDKEKAELADRAAYLYGEIETCIEEQKATAKQAKALIDEKKAEHKRVNMEYREGSKYERVKCERRLNFRLGSCTEVRTDTGEIIHERALSERERQQELPGVGAESAESVPDGPTEPPLNTQKPPRKKGGRKPKAD